MDFIFGVIADLDADFAQAAVALPVRRVEADDVAAAELSLRRLAEEISRTTRRVNALEHVVVPRLERERDAIAMVLAERELEDRVRLRRARAAGHRRRAREAAA